jgi:type IV pilus assembly protein PilC
MFRLKIFGAVLRRPGLSFLRRRRPEIQDFMNFCHQFAAMLTAGIPVLAGLEILGEQTESYRLREGIRAAARRVEQGNTLTEALLQEKKLFSPFFLGMVEAGETGGILDQTMQRLALHFKNKHDLEQKIKTATIYPKFIFLFILGVAAFLLAFIVPAFAETFQGMGAKLPLPTRLLIFMGKGLRTCWHFVILGGTAVYLILLRAAKTKKGAYYLDRLRLRLPLFGRLYYKMMLVQFCQIFSAMLNSGVDILKALDLLKNVISNSVFHERIHGIKESIIKGEGIAETLASAGIFPRLIIGMASVGEQSGRLEEMLGRAADLYESEVSYTAERLGALIEPALILFLALLVGGVMLSVFLPLFNIFSLYL